MKNKDFSKIVKKLKRKFVLIEDSTDHISYEIYYENILITLIKTSHSPKDYQDQFIAQNLHISKTELKNYVACNFSNLDLINKIEQKGYWPKGIKY